MAMLASYVRLRRGEFSRLPDTQHRREILRLFDGIGAQVAAMAELHRMLTAGASLSSGDIGEHLGHICAAFRKGPASDSLIEYSGEPGCMLPVSHILPVSQIVSEVMTNALKYGRKAGSAGSIRVGCRRLDGDQILISVDDDGGGIVVDSSVSTKPKGIGVAMVAALVQQVNGKIDLQSSDRGVSFSLSLRAAKQPIAAHAPFVSQYVCASS